ncbi:FG-GAP-like repeat-containing protein [Arthrobacter sp. VKM Ac-2550]|uniref:FG-GAP-like repeat-containing protein n=1 Tax=Crystallibacter permensis TaxID=1938888 RepID=UPI002227F3F1|nr:FG-GAP-like repeat-containing protein [Arthrobacter sp. VKM Ac-2550]MCW2131668.1 hypothetical protein [Arthrobacter sp. VKM Ac-2550]
MKDGTPSSPASPPDTLVRPGSGRGSYSSLVRIGTGWQTCKQQTAVGDCNSDGKNALLAVRPDGKTYFYLGPGTGRRHGPRRVVASGWNAYTEIAPVCDYDGNGTDDVVFHKKDGTLWLRTGLAKRAGSPWFSAARKMGSGGWNGCYRILGASDFNRDRKADMLVTESDGSAWFYASMQFKDAGAVESGVYTDKL